MIRLPRLLHEADSGWNGDVGWTVVPPCLGATAFLMIGIVGGLGLLSFIPTVIVTVCVLFMKEW